MKTSNGCGRLWECGCGKVRGCGWVCACWLRGCLRGCVVVGVGVVCGRVGVGVFLEL